jgi:hypothetical protein
MAMKIDKPAVLESANYLIRGVPFFRLRTRRAEFREVNHRYPNSRVCLDVEALSMIYIKEAHIRRTGIVARLRLVKEATRCLMRGGLRTAIVILNENI